MSIRHLMSCVMLVTEEYDLYQVINSYK